MEYVQCRYYKVRPEPHDYDLDLEGYYENEELEISPSPQAKTSLASFFPKRREAREVVLHLIGTSEGNRTPI